ncbi:MAG: GNAT family N-acetyltransferase [Rhodospirillaceae bacterium]|nr:GNAT family N-acetyltransferase [Rhodospirillaceae bacterium]
MTADDIAIAAAKPAHAAVLEALQAAYLDGPWDEPAWSDAAWGSLLADPTVHVGLAVPAGADPAPLGAFAWRLLVDEAEVLTLGVVPAARRRGLGVRLLDWGLAAAAAAGATRLHLEVADPNTAARALYAARSFTLAGRRRGYYQRSERPADALVMVRPLP